MKILFFSPYSYPYISGLVTFPLKILKYLAKKIDITILTFCHNKNLPCREKVSGINIIRMPFIFKISKGFISPQSIIYFLKYTQKSDLIILNIPNFEGFILAIISKIYHKKIISIFHCQVNLGNDIFSKVINFFLNLSVYLQLLLCSKIIATSKDYINSLLIGKLFRNKISIILPPVHKLPVNADKLAEFKKIKGNSIWVGYTGRISQEKGLEYLIEAVNFIRHSGKRSDSRIVVKNNDSGQAGMTDIELVFAGPYGSDVIGENHYYLKIKNLLDQYKIPCRFFGNLSDGDLGAFYKSIDLLVLPSINKTEAFGMVQVEAMLLGTPVIATNLPGVRIPIQLTGMGILVSPKNHIQIAQAIKNILQNQIKYSNAQLVNNTRKIFNSQKVFDFYDKVLTLTII